MKPVGIISMKPEHYCNSSSQDRTTISKATHYSSKCKKKKETKQNKTMQQFRTIVQKREEKKRANKQMQMGLPVIYFHCYNETTVNNTLNISYNTDNIFTSFHYKHNKLVTSSCQWPSPGSFIIIMRGEWATTFVHSHMLSNNFPLRKASVHFWHFFPHIPGLLTSIHKITYLFAVFVYTFIISISHFRLYSKHLG